jgi:prepilin-type N-terminal cleavage/methylation domain-containing protein
MKKTGLPGGKSSRRGFTLIELMIVVGIIGLIAGISIPAIYHAMHPESLQAGVNDVVDACAKARARAIWESKTVYLRIVPVTGEYQVTDAPADAAPVDLTAPPPAGTTAEAPATAAKPAPETTENGEVKVSKGLSGQLSDHLRIDMLDVNFRECKDDDEVRVRFYPNGTCDEFTIILHSLDTGESRRISLELVTAMPTITQFP